MLLSSERPFVGASAFCIPGATLLRRNGLTQAVLPESDWNMANGQLRFPRNLGESYFCSSAIPGWRYRVINSRLWQCTRLAENENNECIRGIAKRRKRSAARWAAGSRSTFILLLKPGNWSRRTRSRKGKTARGCLMLDPRPGNTSETSYSDSRINVTT